MDPFLLAAASACWLGILTSISPCPLATNIAAISYIGKRVGTPGKVFLSGILYTLGRMLTYLILGVLIVAGMLSIPDLAYFLQKYMNTFLGPILILVGAFLLGLIRLNFSGSGISERIQNRADRYGIWGAGLLGFLFALSFCPISAALFFGSLIPLAVQYESEFLMPTIYGIGTALPVFAFAVLIALGTHSIGRAFNKLTQIELWARRITGVIFVVVGFYYLLVYVFHVDL